MKQEPLFMTPLGYKRLVDEYAYLGQDERPRVVRGVTDAAAEGDRSENAEYIYGKKRLREIDRRMRFLRLILERVQCIDPALDRGDKIYFGATVHLLEHGGAKLVVQLVGEHETDAEAGKISYKSPIGAALMRKEEGDTVRVSTPSGDKEFVIDSVAYIGS